MPQNDRGNPFFRSPLTPLLLSLLLLLFGFFQSGTLSALVFMGISYGVVIFFWCVLQKGRLTAVFPLRKPTGKGMGLAFFSFFALVFLQGLLKYGLFGAEYEEGMILYGFTLAEGDMLGEKLLLLLTVCMAAVLEEALLRGAVMDAYRGAGVIGSILMSALLSMLLTGRFVGAVEAFAVAAVFGIVRFLTGELLSSCVLHMLYGIYLLYFDTFMWRLSLSPQSRVLFICLMLLLAGISLFGAFSFGEKVLRERAERGETAPFRVEKNKRAAVLLDVLSSPVLWVMTLIYLVMAVVRIFAE